MAHLTIEYQHIRRHRSSKLDWMGRADGFRGWRPLHHFPLALAVAKSNKLDPDTMYAAPDGWHWATTAEVAAAISDPKMAEGVFMDCRAQFEQRVAEQPVAHYAGHGGWAAAEESGGCVVGWGGLERRPVSCPRALPRQPRESR